MICEASQCEANSIEGYGRTNKVFVLTEPNPNLQSLQDVINNIEIIECDISKQDKVLQAIKTIKPNVIFHLAAVGIKPGEHDLHQLFNVNFHGTVNLLHACKQVGFECFINTGTASEYGNKEHPLEESMMLAPEDDYSISKAATTLYCQKEAIRNNLPIYTVRPFCLYGDFEAPHRLVPSVIRGALANEPIKLSSPALVRDFIYVKDVANLYLTLADKRPTEDHIFNVGTGKQHTVGDVVATIEKIVDKKLDLRWNTLPPRPWEFKNWQANVERTKNILGWQAKYSLEEGLRQTIKWYERYSSCLH